MEEPLSVADCTDELLVSRIREGDDDAFTAIVDRYKDRLVNYLARLTGDSDRAEDLAQETFVRFFQRFSQYRETGNLAAYLYRIATNLVRSEARRSRRWHLLMPSLRHSTNGHSSHPSPQASALASEEQLEVARALAALDLLYRAPLLLREIEGLKYDQIAAALNCNPGTVKSRLSRGRELLRTQLAPYWNGGRSRAGRQ